MGILKRISRRVKQTMGAVGLLIAAIFTLIASLPLGAQVFMTREEALDAIYGDGSAVEKQRVYLSEELKKEIEARAKAKLESRIHTFYVGKRGEEVLGYSILHTHVVRTHAETLLITINPDGTLRQVDILAFFEPQEYMAGEKWIELFPGKKLSSSLRVGRDIPNMTGATLTSNAVTKAVRTALALFEVACSDGQCKGI